MTEIKQSPVLQTSHKNISFTQWLKGFITIKMTRTSTRELKLIPKWLLLGIIGASYASQYIGTESGLLVFMEFAVIFLLAVFFGMASTV